MTLRVPNGSVVARFRTAAPADIPAIEHLISLSARGLSQGDYSDEQIDAALGSALGVDSQLISDRTYYVAEAADALVACGGWSWRKTLFGSDQGDRQPEPLDPASEAARIRAFFVHPDWARRGLGRLLLARCESEARAQYGSALVPIAAFQTIRRAHEALAAHVKPSSRRASCASSHAG